MYLYNLAEHNITVI